MRMVYIADDGTEFDNEIECNEYEHECNMKNSEIIMLNSNGKKLEITDENYERCSYIKITNDKDLNIIKQMGYNIGLYENPEEIGEFYWNYEDEYWIKIDDRIEELESDLEELKIIKEKLNG